MPAPLNFKLHFWLLAAAVALIAALNPADFFHEPFLPSFAVYGALHALCLALAIPAGRGVLWRKPLFIGCAAALNVAVLYAGIISLQALGSVPAALRLYLALSICALFGAIGYGFVVRFFWLPQLRPRAIARIALGCMAAALLGMGVQHLTQSFGNPWLVAVWWWAFSAGLWGALRRAHPFGTQTQAQ